MDLLIFAFQKYSAEYRSPMFNEFTAFKRHFLDFQKTELDDLERYCRFVLDHVPVIGFVPFSGLLSVISGHSTSLILHRDPPYQAQLILKQPNSIIPPHSHPNVDSIEVYVGGDMRAAIDGDFISPAASVCVNQSHPLKIAAHRGQAVRIHPNQVHGGVIGPSGGAFLSVQKWLHGISPTFVQCDWSGPTLHAEHLSIITSGVPLSQD
jgi:quercetin dioxygenase-like cupin family protein